MLTNGEPVPELAFVCHASKAREKGKKLVAKMKEEIPRQQVSLQSVSVLSCQVEYPFQLFHTVTSV